MNTMDWISALDTIEADLTEARPECQVVLRAAALHILNSFDSFDWDDPQTADAELRGIRHRLEEAVGCVDDWLEP